ncbi:hypothetical protein ABMA28_007413 [Loxostege sticticalis]|uniref:Phospholipid scramblase n=1 Tax=Loxostege sticticalis TaxID=481309 RepID=A0ABD0TQN4_LOXSC
MSSNDDTMTYQNLRRNLPEQPMMPTAPIYVSVPPVDNLPEYRREEMVPLCASPSLDAKKRLRIEAEIKKAQLRREQLVKERQIMEEEFKAKEMLLNAELELVQLENNSVNSVSAQDQVLKLKTRGLNANSRIERPVELPKPLGLEQLSVLDFLSIRQLVSSAVDESYEVVAPENVVILRANMSFGFANVAMHGMRRVIKVDMFDNEVNELVNLSAGATTFMELYVNGELAALIRREPTFFKPLLMLHNSQGKPVLKIKGPSSGSNRNVFSVQTIAKVKIGAIDKSPVHVGPGYVQGNHTVVKFPLDLDVRFKAAIIASSFLIMTQETAKLRKRKVRAAILNATAQNTSN